MTGIKLGALDFIGVSLSNPVCVKSSLLSDRGMQMAFRSCCYRSRASEVLHSPATRVHVRSV